MKNWFPDLALGVRLALGGGRTSWVRLALTAVGIGIGVVVLLAASSVPTMLAERNDRTALNHKQYVGRGNAVTGDVLYLKTWGTQFESRPISGSFVLPSGPGAPVPPGVSRVPGVGEIAVSPALAELLDSPEGERLRERFPQRRVGVIGQDGLNAPNDLSFIAGDRTVQQDASTAVRGFGGDVTRRTFDPVLSLLVMVGLVALLFPVLVFVGITTRLAGAERDRRLAALRLVGAGAQRVRRIAAGEALLGALAGLVLGAVAFAGARQFTEQVEVMGISVFVGDAMPSPLLALLIAVLVPLLAVVTSQVSMRRTVIEPLGVVRRAKPVRRVMWWRLIPAVLGAAALISQAGEMGERGGDVSETLVIGGILLLMLSIPLLLPWLVERVVGRLHGGAPSWQLAVRRLQLESGTAARVVGGVAVVLAGGIALQSVMVSAETKLVDRPTSSTDHSRMVVSLDGEAPRGTADEAARLLKDSPLVHKVDVLSWVSFKYGEDDYTSAMVATCDTLRTQAKLDSCQDGDSFYLRNGAYTNHEPDAPPGTEVTVIWNSDGEQVTGPKWTVPEYREVGPPEEFARHATSGMLLTPGALAGLDVPVRGSSIMVRVDPDRSGVAEDVRNLIGPMTWRAYAYYADENNQEDQAKQFLSIRRALLAGSLATLLLAGASLLILALEQVRERRRPLAVLAASGVPRGALARSMLWQNALPLLLSVLVAVAVGAGLAVLLLRVVEQPIVIDWAGVGLLSGAAALLVVVVTLLSLPALRRATGALGLRSE
ncbi:FtsX-like permease family protein [Saccharothrix obliqua]|uniref:FtsX-like permease family protein n=1 Tax=Saccharothrix obliqua TaxID=2861747 RepID=UPI001C5E5D74|nr:FtsX-like permease family protein [Saccharothrix obliqua]MBW4715792.1 ABC transporter permease [Saccharothrix obliqua]